MRHREILDEAPICVCGDGRAGSVREKNVAAGLSIVVEDGVNDHTSVA